MAPGLLQRLAKSPGFGHAAELGGLGVLALPPIYNALRNDDKPESRTERALSGATEVGGLGLLAAPTVLKLLANRRSP